ncbi:hypothetical protein [Cyanobacterium sp. Dongsha4]|uniref:hypothetical protein n=1 Tax=Cyanobacterium sp. DS4 TaxID=2878255 RepID=UPI002E8247D5|nr:hypothetical protein [Cyanobacterium sp. Dongsha4]WVL02022.1 hypothetical protein Dongsha4_07500 [Cyanobacterium sp. Dongsha4]
MNGKVIDSGANSIPLVLLPLAFIIIIVFVAWPLLVAIFIFALGLKLWERFRLQQLSEEIDPYFNNLIQAHQGCVTVLDLTNKTELKSKTARWYLDQKAEEYGAVKRQYEDKGIVYYFLTASTLGSILDDSEPDDSDTDEDINIASSSQQSSSSYSSISPASSPTPEVKLESVTITPPENPPSSPPPVNDDSVSNTSPEVETSTQEEDKSDTLDSQEENGMSLNQSDLAKRLEVHPSTVGKRKSDRDFGLWSQSRDPDGIPWQYIEDTKMFVPLK